MQIFIEYLLQVIILSAVDHKLNKMWFSVFKSVGINETYSYNNDRA